MDLIPSVVSAVAMFASILSIGIAVMFIGVAIARISVDFFKS